MQVFLTAAIEFVVLAFVSIVTIDFGSFLADEVIAITTDKPRLYGLYSTQPTLLLETVGNHIHGEEYSISAKPIFVRRNFGLFP